MADATLGRGVIELVADARKLKAGIEDAKRSIRTLGDGQRDISASASRSSLSSTVSNIQPQARLWGTRSRRSTCPHVGHQ